MMNMIPSNTVARRNPVAIIRCWKDFGGLQPARVPRGESFDFIAACCCGSPGTMKTSWTDAMPIAQFRELTEGAEDSRGRVPRSITNGASAIGRWQGLLWHLEQNFCIGNSCIASKMAIWVHGSPSIGV